MRRVDPAAVDAPPAAASQPDPVAPRAPAKEEYAPQEVSTMQVIEQKAGAGAGGGAGTHTPLDYSLR